MGIRGLQSRGVGGGAFDRGSEGYRNSFGRPSFNDQELAELDRLGLLPNEYPQYQETPFSSNLPELDRRLGEVSYNKEGFEALRRDTLRSGPSAWADLAKRRQSIDEQDQAENLTRQSAGQYNTALSRLASSGGLATGARERLARNSMQDAFAQRQALSRQGGVSRLGIDLQDETTRQTNLRALPQLEAQSAQTEFQTKVNPWMQLADREQERRANLDTARNEFNLGRFNTQMGAYGSLKTAQATRDASKRGRFLGIF